MAPPLAELVFLTGPQAGERHPLFGQSVILGRSGEADIPLREEYASREQAVFDLTADGWLMTNLSAAGTLVNGKRFKSDKKKLLLGTGDVLGAGAETLLLFVERSDQVEQALAAYRAAHPASAEAAADVTTGPARAFLEEPAEAVAAPAAEKKSRRKKPPSADTPASSAKSAKLRKYAMFFGVYMLGLAGLVVLLSVMREKPTQVAQRSAALTDERIAEIFSAVDERTPIPTRSAMELREAQSLYDNLPSKEGDLYRCVRGFQDHLAYKRIHAFDSAEDERKYQDALRRLIETLQRKYRSAWAYEQAEDWRLARSGYEELLRMVPEDRPGSRVQQAFVQNVIDHVTYVRDKLRVRRR